jgi:MFS family permease
MGAFMELSPEAGVLACDARIAGMTTTPARLTPVQRLICGIAALGFAFDLYELIVLPVVLRPALGVLGNLKPGNPQFNLWVGLLFYVPAAIGGAFGLLGGYLTDLFGRRRILFWSILIYTFSAFAASHANSLLQLLIFRCTTIAGVAVEYPAAIAWLAELFSNPKQRESVLGYTQSAAGLGGMMGTGAYYVAVTYAEHFPAIHGGHEAWRYALFFGLLPAIPLILIRPFLPESPTWREKRSKGTLKRPSISELFRPALVRSTLVTTILVACLYAIAFGVLQQTPRMVPGLPEVRGLAPRPIEQAVGSVQFIGELGTLAGRLLFAFLIVRIASQKRFLRFLLAPGLVLFCWVYLYAATHSLVLLKYGIFLAALLMNAPMSLLWNYLPRIYPTHLRGTGESFAFNVGGRILGTSAAVLTTQLASVMPGAGPAARLACSAGAVVILVYSVSLIASCWLREPEGGQLPD